MPTKEFDFFYYHFRSDGEAYRRIGIAVTQNDGKVKRIDAYETDDPPKQPLVDAQLHGFLDTFRDGSCIVTITTEQDGAVLDLAKEFHTLIPVDADHIDNRYTFQCNFERAKFQMLCGG